MVWKWSVLCMTMAYMIGKIVINTINAWSFWWDRGDRVILCIRLHELNTVTHDWIHIFATDMYKHNTWCITTSVCILVKNLLRDVLNKVVMIFIDTCCYSLFDIIYPIKYARDSDLLKMQRSYHISSWIDIYRLPIFCGVASLALG